MIQSYTAPNGKTLYKVRVYTRSNKSPDLRVTRQESGIESEERAKRIEATLKKECERELHETEARGVLFGELVEGWYAHFEKLKVATGQRSKTTHEEYLGGIRKWFHDHWKKPATEINPYVVSAVFESMKQKDLCFGYRKKLKQILKSVFDYGIQSGQLPSLSRSPTFEVALKRDEEKKPEILTITEIQTLMQKAYESEHEWRRVWAVALLTGMRSGELYALKWNDVDWENRLINVNQSYNCRRREFKSTKAGLWRQVPISESLELVLKEQLQETGTGPQVFPRQWEWDKGLQAKVLRRFCYLHGLPSIKFHTLRACFATQMLRSGVEAARVMKVCGWKELKTMQHYVRLAGIEVQGVTEGLQIFPKNGPNDRPAAGPPGRETDKETAREGSEQSGPSFFMRADGIEPRRTSPDVTGR